MNKIYEENAVQIVAGTDGIVVVSQEDSDQNQAFVTYRQYSPRSKRMMPVTKSVYLQAKFGDDHATISSHLPDYINYMVTELPDGRMLCTYPTGDSVVFSVGGFVEWRGTLTHHGEGPSGIVGAADALWVSYREHDTIVRYRLSSMREELRIGSPKDETFSRPGALSVENGRLIVCNEGSCCIESVDPKNYSVETLFSFDEPVYQFVRSGDRGFVLLASGVYQL